MGFLKAHGIPVWITHDARHHPVEKGIADICAVLPGGIFFACEVKAPGREKAHADTRSRQSAWLYQVERKGAVTCQASQLQDVLTALQGRGMVLRADSAVRSSRSSMPTSPVTRSTAPAVDLETNEK